MLVDKKSYLAMGYLRFHYISSSKINSFITGMETNILRELGKASNIMLWGYNYIIFNDIMEPVILMTDMEHPFLLVIPIC